MVSKPDKYEGESLSLNVAQPDTRDIHMLIWQMFFCVSSKGKIPLNQHLGRTSEGSRGVRERADYPANTQVRPLIPAKQADRSLGYCAFVRVCVRAVGCIHPSIHPSPHRSDGKGQHSHHPVPQANQLPQLALLLPAVASLSQQAGHIDQDTHSEKHRLDHLRRERPGGSSASSFTARSHDTPVRKRRRGEGGGGQLRQYMFQRERGKQEMKSWERRGQTWWEGAAETLKLHCN